MYLLPSSAWVNFLKKKQKKHCDRSSTSMIGTDKPCEWTRSRKESRPVEVENLDFRAKTTVPIQSQQIIEKLVRDSLALMQTILKLNA